jgi:hypothetical protein
LEPRNAFTEAQNNYTFAILDYKLAEIQLIKSKGELKSLLIINKNEKNILVIVMA